MYNAIQTQITSEPATEPVSLAEAKLYLRVDSSDEDDLITSMIVSARQMIENHLRSALITQTRKMTLDDFPASSSDVNKIERLSNFQNIAITELQGEAVIYLWPRPIQSITSITTYNDNNDATVFSASLYRLDAANGRVVLNEGQVWPSDLRDESAVEVVYVCGYGAAGDVPEAIKQAIKMLIAQMYESRDKCEMTARS